MIYEGNLDACCHRLKTDEARSVLRGFVDLIAETLSERIDKVDIFEDKAIIYFSGGREILRINIGRYNLRVYVHPPAGALFDPDVEFEVEKFNLWDSAFRKTSGKYCGMSFWLSRMEHLDGAVEILKQIPSK